ncbi:hypothetical protein DSM112329_02928 [Paraconexibacter sp. AEG42_29]|uniref:DUF5666 domain-containing protein n=1 Tax=Paraconexibacter sp. AEG42_29 TaxID=2997339 RepID=A0AAU7AWS8_9ACTN
MNGPIRPGRAVTAVVLAGLLLGTLLALTLREDQAPAPLRQPATLTVSAGSVHARQPGDPRFEVRGPVRIALRVADPDGRPDWAVRLVESRAVVKTPGAPIYTSAWLRCAHLGRIVDGRFGWINDTGAFTPVAPTALDSVPHTCGSARRLAGRDAASDLISLIRTAPDGEVDAARTVAFGRTGPATADVTLTDRGRPITGTVRGGAFLLFGPPDPGPRDLRLQLRFRGLASIDRDLSGIRRGGPTDTGHQETPIPGTERIAARTPDPAGGPPFGIAVSKAKTAGVWCPAQPRRVVGRRVGSLDRALGVFRAGVTAVTCPNDRFPLTDDAPLRASISASQGRSDDAETDRVQRRSQSGTTLISGQARSDVRTLEVATSRDVRTLQPDPVTGTFITAYNGELPLETVTITATLQDRTTRVQRIVQR